MRMVRMRRVAPIAPLVAALAALAAVALSGCGATSAIDPVAQAAGVTQHAGGARVLFQAHFAVGDHTIGETGQGSFDLSGQDGSMAMDITGFPAPLGPGPVHVNAVMKSLIAYYLYDSPAIVSRLGTRWIELDLRGLAAQVYGLDPRQLSGAGANPAEILGSLLKSGGATVVGHELLRGTPTTHYRAFLHAPKSMACLPGEIPVDVWVDGRHLVRRVQESLRFPRGIESAHMDVTTDFVSFGQVPVVVAPAPGDVVNITSQAAALTHC
jgi:hypothetical protein